MCGWWSELQRSLSERRSAPATTPTHREGLPGVINSVQLEEMVLTAVARDLQLWANLHSATDALQIWLLHACCPRSEPRAHPVSCALLLGLLDGLPDALQVACEVHGPLVQVACRKSHRPRHGAGISESRQGEPPQMAQGGERVKGERGRVYGSRTSFWWGRGPRASQVPFLILAAQGRVRCWACFADTRCYALPLCAPPDRSISIYLDLSRSTIYLTTSG